MSARLHALLAAKLEEVAALYRVRPRLTLIVRVPGRPDECAFLSDDNWTDAVRTVHHLQGGGASYVAGPPEPPPEADATARSAV